MGEFNFKNFEENEEKKLQDTFSRYFSDTMSPSEKKSFEDKLEADPAFKVRFEREQLLDLHIMYLNNNENLTIEQLDRLIELADKYPEEFEDTTDTHTGLMKGLKAEREKRNKNKSVLLVFVKTFLAGNSFEDSETAKAAVDIFTEEKDEETLNAIIAEVNDFTQKHQGMISSLVGVIVTKENFKDVMQKVYIELYEKNKK